MPQMYFPGEVELRVAVDDQPVQSYAVAKQKVIDLQPGSRIHIKEPKRFAETFEVEITARAHDERGNFFKARKL